MVYKGLRGKDGCFIIVYGADDVTVGLLHTAKYVARRTVRYHVHTTTGTCPANPDDWCCQSQSVYHRYPKSCFVASTTSRNLKTAYRSVDSSDSLISSTRQFRKTSGKYLHIIFVEQHYNQNMSCFYSACTGFAPFHVFRIKNDGSSIFTTTTMINRLTMLVGGTGMRFPSIQPFLHLMLPVKLRRAVFRHADHLTNWSIQR